MTEEKITADQLVEDVVSKYPETVKVFMDYGIPCLVCGEPIWGSVEENARQYDVDPEPLLVDLNNSLAQSGA